MRILYFGDALSIHTRRWVTYFANNGCYVAIVSNRGASFNGIAVFNIADVRYPRKLLEIRRLIDKFKPEIIHSHYITSYGFWGALSGFHPFVLTGWGSDILVTPRRSWLLRQITRFTLRKADLITADAKNMISEIETLSGIKKNTQLIQWGVDLAQFNREGREAMRSRLGWSGKFVFLSTRSLEENYNVSAIISAFTLGAAQLPDAVLVIIGEGHQKSSLQQQAKKSGLGNRILFAGAIPYQDISCYYKAADIYLTIPSSDATSMSLLEAMACGLPVIASDIPANHEWVNEGIGGYFVKPGDIQGIADRIDVLYHNSEKRSLCVTTNQAVVKARANHQSEMERMMNLYRKVLSESK